MSAAALACRQPRQGHSCLAEGEVERRALVGPASIVDVGVLLGLVVEQREAGEVVGEGGDRPRAGERMQRPLGLDEVVLGGLVGDVLAEALLAAAGQSNDLVDFRRNPLETCSSRPSQVYESTTRERSRTLS